MFFRRLGCVFACVALINISDLDSFAGLGWHSLGKFGDLSSILLIVSCSATAHDCSRKSCAVAEQLTAILLYTSCNHVILQQHNYAICSRCLVWATFFSARRSHSNRLKAF